jgi:hypothetical protein
MIEIFNKIKQGLPPLAESIAASELLTTTDNTISAKEKNLKERIDSGAPELESMINALCGYYFPLITKLTIDGMRAAEPENDQGLIIAPLRDAYIFGQIVEDLMPHLKPRIIYPFLTTHIAIRSDEETIKTMLNIKNEDPQSSMTFLDSSYHLSIINSLRKRFPDLLPQRVTVVNPIGEIKKESTQDQLIDVKKICTDWQKKIPDWLSLRRIIEIALRFPTDPAHFAQAGSEGIMITHGPRMDTGEKILGIESLALFNLWRKGHLNARYPNLPIYSSNLDWEDFQGNNTSASRYYKKYIEPFVTV